MLGDPQIFIRVICVETWFSVAEFLDAMEKLETSRKNGLRTTGLKVPKQKRK